jgi:hypothetical protein
MKKLETLKCLLEADPLAIQLQIGRELGEISCRKCDRSCFASSLSEVSEPGLVLYFRGSDTVNGAVELAEDCKSRNKELRKAVSAIVVTGSVANDHREDMPWGDSGVAYQAPLTDQSTKIQFIEPF